MTGIFTRWRQFGRRYFWPHLLLGVVAASFGLPALPDSVQASAAPQPAAHKPQTDSDIAARVQPRLPAPPHQVASFSADGWQQRTFPTIIHNLSFSLAPQILLLAQSQHAQHLALISEYALLATRPVVTSRTIAGTPRPLSLAFHTRQWIRQAQGIRAGPNAHS